MPGRRIIAARFTKIKVFRHIQGRKRSRVQKATDNRKVHRSVIIARKRSRVAHCVEEHKRSHKHGNAHVQAHLQAHIAQGRRAAASRATFRATNTAANSEDRQAQHHASKQQHPCTARYADGEEHNAQRHQRKHGKRRRHRNRDESVKPQPPANQIPRHIQHQNRNQNRKTKGQPHTQFPNQNSKPHITQSATSQLLTCPPNAYNTS